MLLSWTWDSSNLIDGFRIQYIPVETGANQTWIDMGDIGANEREMELSISSTGMYRVRMAAVPPIQGSSNCCYIAVTLV